MKNLSLLKTHTYKGHLVMDKFPTSISQVSYMSLTSLIKRVRDIMHIFNTLFPLYLGFKASDHFNVGV